ncbi:hypothetical protein DRB17_19735 [Ferruginivarius sediminum]|uniref:Uncharacterized protein n=1 Tax=Ferruginivarius sediminum TaxID=2661937 RepID=A0A369T6Y6_9PROT|nr:hypothetical protein DRB17_19735 [Ferruginivarius sediminum]
MRRAPPSGVQLSQHDAAIAKGMLGRGDRQHDIAAWFGVNGGRIAELANGERFRGVEPAPHDELPPPGPYLPGQSARATLAAIRTARNALDAAERLVRERTGL